MSLARAKAYLSIDSIKIPKAIIVLLVINSELDVVKTLCVNNYEL